MDLDPTYDACLVASSPVLDLQRPSNQRTKTKFASFEFRKTMNIQAFKVFVIAIALSLFSRLAFAETQAVDHAVANFTTNKPRPRPQR
jgi:uncharacterized membrane protein